MARAKASRKTIGDQDQCLCGSAKAFMDCCALYLRGGALAPDPVTLMRSRYTAFCLDDIAYLKKTWSAETFPDDLVAGEPSNWIGLEILDSEIDGDEAEVEFRARLIFKNKLETLHEVSYFDRVDGAWLYHSGDFENEGAKPVAIAKDGDCPCGSGKSFGTCHYE